MAFVAIRIAVSVAYSFAIGASVAKGLPWSLSLAALNIRYLAASISVRVRPDHQR